MTTMATRSIFLTVLLALTAACSNVSSVTRQITALPAPPDAVAERNYRVVDVDVFVPYTLRVSEAHRYYPSADIVWREDPPGDRHLQVLHIMQDASARATGGLNGWQDVHVAIEVKRFHSVTEKALYTIGGVHSIQFLLAVYDARTGEVIEEPRLVDASLVANGGRDAVRAKWTGRTPKVRLHDHLAGVIQRELTPPYLYQAPSFADR